MANDWQAHWREARVGGRSAFVRGFVRRTWLWHSVISATLYAAATIWLFSSLDFSDEATAVVWVVACFLGALVAMLLLGILVALLIWQLNEWRFERADRIDSIPMGPHQ